MWDQKKFKQRHLIALVILLIGFSGAEEARALCNIAIAPIETNEAQINKIISTRLQGPIKEKLSTLDPKCENASRLPGEIRSSSVPVGVVVFCSKLLGSKHVWQAIL